MSSGTISAARIIANYQENIDVPPAGVCILHLGTLATGTKPTDLNSTTYLLFSFSGYTNNVFTYGSQMAISFGNNLIAKRNAPYNTSGATWSDWVYYDAAFAKKVVSTTITNASDTNKTILQRGLISQAGMYFIQLSTQMAATNAVSTYHVRYYNSTFYVTPMFEGTHASAPRISSTGVLGLNSATPSNTIIRACVQPVLLQ